VVAVYQITGPWSAVMPGLSNCMMPFIQFFMLSSHKLQQETRFCHLKPDLVLDSKAAYIGY